MMMGDAAKNKLQDFKSYVFYFTTELRLKTLNFCNLVGTENMFQD